MERKKLRIAGKIDGFVNSLKWPSALLACCAAPLFAFALASLAWRILTSPWSLLPFAFGCVAFVIIWRRVFGPRRWGRFLITLEHESTHALFALLTGHRIISFKASLGRGGEVRYTGPGNWLITVAPYFFPTASLILFLLAYLLPFPGLPWRGLLLGVSLGYHVISTYRETHRDQSDIQELGKTFCWLFLPAANLAVVGLLISFAHGGSEGLSDWFADILWPVEFLRESIFGVSESSVAGTIDGVLDESR
ncbi:MAG: M50 family metallopeptidase [Aureliella sp.]